VLAMLGCIALFYLLFRSGLNQRARDPSLTAPQIISAILVLTVAMYYAESDIRALFHLIMLMCFLFGVFRLDTVALLWIGLVAVTAYGAMIFLLLEFHPARIDRSLELLRWGVITAILVWFSMMGGYMSRLRKQLAEGKAELEGALKTIHDMAIRDELTGAHNRRFLMSALGSLHARSSRTGEAFCVAIADIDHFKKVNDLLGHAGGDHVLRCFSSNAERELRAMDQFGRYGGEEFMLIMNQTTLDSAMLGAERLRRNTERIRFPEFDPDFRLTVSVGVAQHRRGETIEDTVRRADEALYRAKSGGRNRVECEPLPDAG